MKKEDLILQGLSEEQAKFVMTEHGKSMTIAIKEVEALKQAELDLKQQLADRDKDLSKLQKDNTDNETLKEQIKTLQVEYKELEKENAEKLESIQKQQALNEALSEVKAKNSKAVSALLDHETIVWKDGKLTGLSEQLEALKESDSYLFDLGTKKAPYVPKGGKATEGLTDVASVLKEGANLTEFLKKQVEENE